MATALSFSRQDLFLIKMIAKTRLRTLSTTLIARIKHRALTIYGSNKDNDSKSTTAELHP